MAEERTYNRIIGEFLGYPDCCVKAFGDVAVLAVHRPEIVREMACNGFLPCEHHAHELKEGKISYEALINTEKRQCIIPFTSLPFTPITNSMVHIAIDNYLKTLKE